MRGLGHVLDVLRWEAWRVFAVARDFVLASDETAASRRWGSLGALFLLASLLALGWSEVSAFVIGARNRSGVIAVILLLLAHEGIRRGRKSSASARASFASWYVTAGVTPPARATRAVLEHVVISSPPAIVLGLLLSARGIDVRVVLLGAAIGATCFALKVWSDTLPRKGAWVVSGLFLAAGIRLFTPAFHARVVHLPPFARVLVAGDLTEGLRAVTESQQGTILLLALTLVLLGLAIAVASRAEDRRGWVDLLRTSRRALRHGIGTIPAGSVPESPVRALALRDSWRLVQASGTIGTSEWLGLPAVLAFYVLLGAAPDKAVALLGDGNISLLALLAGIPAALVISELFGVDETRGMWGWLRLVCRSTVWLWAVRFSFLAAVLGAWGGVLTAVLGVALGSTPLTRSHGLLWLLIAPTVAAMYLATTLVALRTSTQGTEAGRVIRSVGVVLGAATPTGIWLATGSTLATVSGTLLVITVAGGIGMYLLSRAELDVDRHGLRG